MLSLFHPRASPPGPYHLHKGLETPGHHDTDDWQTPSRQDNLLFLFLARTIHTVGDFSLSDFSLFISLLTDSCIF